MKPVIYLFFLNLLLAITGCQSAQQAEDRMVRAFSEAMFPEEISGGHMVESMPNRAPHLTRWEGEVRVSLIEGDTPETAAASRAVLDEFATLSGVQIVWLEPGDDTANLLIYYSKKDQFVINGSELANCYSGIKSKRDWSIGLTEVHVGTDRETGAYRDCLVHELLHAFGWRGHTHRVRSANSYVHGETALTRWDRILMRAQYDPRLVTGSAKDDALPAARVIIRELMKDE